MRPLTHVVRELEADAVACVVAEALGLNAIQLHQGSIELLAASLGRIRRVASDLLAATQTAFPDAREVFSHRFSLLSERGRVPVTRATNPVFSPFRLSKAMQRLRVT